MKQTNTSAKPFYLSFLVVLFMFVSCTANNSNDEASAALVTPSPDVATESPSPAPTSVEISDEDIVMSLVEAKVRQITGYDESVTIEVEPTLGWLLPGLTLYVATPLVVDELDYRCAVYGEEVWCSEEALPNIVRQFDLGSNPEQLSDQRWLALVAFFTTTPLDGPDDLRGVMDRNIPDNERAKISPPVINRLKPAGIEITFYFEGGDLDLFFLSLNVMDVTVTDDNEVTIQHREVWHFYNE
jgi:hypothetical protein